MYLIYKPVKLAKSLNPFQLANNDVIIDTLIVEVNADAYSFHVVSIKTCFIS